MVPKGENSFLKRSSSIPSSRFFTYRLTPWKYNTFIYMYRFNRWTACCQRHLSLTLLSVAHIYPQNSLAGTWGPWTTVTVAAILANATQWGGSTEFDKAAEALMCLTRQGDCHSFISNWPGSESCGPVSFAQTCAWAPPVAPLSSVRGQRKWVSRSSLSRSSHPQPAANKKSKSLQNKAVGVS